MFRWYKNSVVCYAYLNDVSRPPTLHFCQSFSQGFRWRREFSNSRWFTRGWTLQELIAPEHLTFYSIDWQNMGTKVELQHFLFKITKIPRDPLLFGDTFGQSMAQRMSWAAKRQTTRIEDMAYCLLGIFNINMPLLYGEGGRAFQRLQEEIVKLIDDETIFAWKASSHTYATWRSLFASSPAEFMSSGNFVPLTGIQSPQAHTITNKGLQIRFPLIESQSVEEKWSSGTEFIALLRCHEARERSLSLEVPYTGILIKRIINDEYVRVDPGQLNPVFLSSYPSGTNDFTSIAVKQMVDYSPYYHLDKCFRIGGIWIKTPVRFLSVTEVQPEAQWNPEKQLLKFDEQMLRLGQRQVMTVVLEYSSASKILELTYDPRKCYNGRCCSHKTKGGRLNVIVEALVRVIEGEAVLVVTLRL